MNNDLKFILLRCLWSSNGLRKCGAMLLMKVYLRIVIKKFDWNKSFRMGYEVKVVQDGYSTFEDGVYKANGTCTLILGPQYKVIVDTLSAWDKGGST